MSDDTSIYAVNDSGEACMRVSENVTSTDPTSIYGVNEDGKAAVRVLGTDGGGDQHNLGWYATPEALRTAYATATAGDWAIVGSTDTVWIWDTDTNAWKDSDQKGQVTSVNGQTGAVVIDALQNTATGSDSLTISGSPNSNANSVNIGIGSVADYNGVSIGCNAGKNTSSSVNITESVFIGMGAQAFRNSTDCRYSIGIGQGAEVKDAKGGISIGWGSGVYSERAIGIGYNARALAFHSIQLGSPSSGTTAFNNDANTFKVANANGNFEIMSADGTIPSDRLKNAINKYSTMPTASVDNLGWIVQFTGTTDSTYTHGHLYECVNDGADPATYSWEEVSLGGGGVSDVTVNGTSVVSGGVAAITGMLQNTGTRGSLTLLGQPDSQGNNIDIGTQSGIFGLGGYNPPSQSIAIGYGAKIYGRYTSVDNIALGYFATVGMSSGSSSTEYGNGNIAIGAEAVAYATDYSNSSSIAIGKKAKTTRTYSIAVGNYATVTAIGAIQLGANGTNDEAGTLKVRLGTTWNGTGWANYKLLDSDGTIPAARHAALPSADGTYVLKLVITDGVPTLSWVAE